MNIVFRADASLDIGSGHVMRCLALADAWRQQGARCHFACRAHPGNLIAKICESGFAVTELPNGAVESRGDVLDADPLPSHASWLGADWRTDADATQRTLQALEPDWLVVDHYALDGRWEQQVRRHCKHLMIIDDLADRTHDCDLLLDQTLDRTARDYSGLVPEHCLVRTGPRYALLRPEFAALRDDSLRRRASSAWRSLLITMGGIDSFNATGRVLAALSRCELPQDCTVVVVMGRHAPWIEDVRERARALPWPCEVKVDATDIARLLVKCDLAIGAAGGSAWERCALGVPSLVVVTARNQEGVARSLARAGAVRLVGDVESVEQTLPAMLRTIGSRQLTEMSSAASKICDGQGTGRVIDTMRIWGVQVRRMREDDLELVLQWRNHPDIRRWMYSSHQISPSEHREWYAGAQEDRRRHLLIVEEAGVPFGFVQFTQTGNDGVADWGFYTLPGAPRGSGRKLGLAALNYAFTRIGLRKVRGEAIAFNEISAAFHRKLGFAEEGVLNDRFFDGATYHPVLCFGLEAAEWLGRQ